MKKRYFWVLLLLGLVVVLVSFRFLVKPGFAQVDYYVSNFNYLQNIFPGQPVFSSSVSLVSVSAARGEQEPVSIVVRALKNLQNVQVSVTDLVMDSGKIPKENIDIRIVGLMQKRRQTHLPADPENLIVVPEILEKNRPVSFVGNKQWWLIVKIPENAPAGTYRGSITISPANSAPYNLPLAVEVYPFSLVTLTNKHPGIFYYFFTCNDQEADTCSVSKDRYARLRENLAVIKKAGLEGVILDFSPGISFNNGQVRMNYEDLRQVLAIIKEFGFTQPVPYHGIMRASVRIAALPLTEAEKKAVYLQMIRDLQQLVADNDLPEILFYPVDEADTKTGGYQEVAKYCQWIREADPRARIFISGGAAFLDQRRDLLDSYADIWYVGVLGDTGAVRNYCAGRPAGKECWFYANSTNRGNEAEYARRTFGFWFYQSPFTRQYPWAYRYYTLDPFNDTDGSWGDFVYVYPDQENNWSPNLPSLKWEGIREGIDDLRYLATLEEAIRAAPASLAAKKTEAANYLNWLKQAPEFRVFWEVGNPSKLESYNANRRRIANFIIQLNYIDPVVTLSPTAFPTATNSPLPTINTPIPSNPVPTELPCPLKETGDANRDDKIDGVDFEIWREEFLGSRTTQSADFNCDSKIDGVDFEIWRRNNGNS